MVPLIAPILDFMSSPWDGNSQGGSLAWTLTCLCVANLRVTSAFSTNRVVHCVSMYTAGFPSGHPSCKQWRAGNGGLLTWEAVLNLSKSVQYAGYCSIYTRIKIPIHYSQVNTQPLCRICEKPIYVVWVSPTAFLLTKRDKFTKEFLGFFALRSTQVRNTWNKFQDKLKGSAV